MGPNQETETEFRLKGEGPMTSKALGAYLKAEREKQGLTLNDVLERTRLQPFLLSAIEKEDWDLLPSPALAKGFICSYAKALGLDAGKLLELYHEELPTKQVTLTPLEEQPKRRRPALLLLPCGLVLLGVIAFLLLARGPSVTTVPNASKTGESAEAPAPAEVSQPAGTSAPAPAPPPQSTLAPNSPAAPAPPLSPSQSEPPEKARESLAENEAQENIQPADQPVEQVLKMEVLKRTWVKILVDDLPPEERIFPPGTQKEWHAKKGFELRIGNAGGIRLELNAHPVEPLGKDGQVIRLNLPQGYERKHQER